MVKTALIELERLLKCNIVVLVAYLYCIQSFLLFALYTSLFYYFIFVYNCPCCKAAGCIKSLFQKQLRHNW